LGFLVIICLLDTHLDHFVAADADALIFTG
jgi:integrase